ncbi:hypothetical protein CKO23_23185 [Thiocystis violacea]|nr:hypothetical protein [Thiocystis violacea]
MNKRRFRCPDCGHKTGVAILYGYPTQEAQEAAERQEVVLGGCCCELNAPERQCIRCGHTWRIQRRSSHND